MDKPFKMDFCDTLLYHSIVAVISLLLILILYFTGTDFGRAVAAMAFFLLFLTLIIGPIMKIWKPFSEASPWDLPWSCRKELGIWFMIFSVSHMLLVLDSRYWGALGYSTGMRFSDMIAFIVIFWALVLTVASFGRVIEFLGISAWRWLYRFTYIIFYLTGAHVISRADRPLDWLRWAYLFMIVLVILLQSVAFIKTVANYRKTMVR